MKFAPIGLAGACTVDIEPFEDERGLFARAWCSREFEAAGLNAKMVQTNLSFNRRAGTMRGMHWQEAPYSEAKLMRCVRGAIYDVIVDLRPASVTYLQWRGVTLTADNRRALLVPEGFAHGFQTLEDNTEVMYQVSQFYTPEAERGARFDDPTFAIDWLQPVASVSAKDRAWPDFASDGHGATAPEQSRTRP